MRLVKFNLYLLSSLFKPCPIESKAGFTPPRRLLSVTGKIAKCKNRFFLTKFILVQRFYVLEYSKDLI
ncbi:hypothetical protein THERMOT_1744 [Bathymodiolus thermophilus thioautotrophic gill symbiont]|nr:hypothetical protein THERMOT_1744 [Bathymodiolus thermophilus thioautotrophic gill symbiont]